MPSWYREELCEHTSARRRGPTTREGGLERGRQPMGPGTEEAGPEGQTEGWLRDAQRQAGPSHTREQGRTPC